MCEAVKTGWKGTKSFGNRSFNDQTYVQPMKIAFMLLMPCQPQLNLDYLDSLGPHEIVRIIEGLDSGKCEY